MPWIDSWPFTRFITLAFNDDTYFSRPDLDSKLPGGRLLDRLRHWDGRMNHAILGKHWADRHADRMFAIYVPEKVVANPHWHGLIRFFPDFGMSVGEQEAIFDSEAERIWKKLVPSGSTAVRPIFNQRNVVTYVAKELGRELSYDNFVVPDEFSRFRSSGTAM